MSDDRLDAFYMQYVSRKPSRKTALHYDRLSLNGYQDYRLSCVNQVLPFHCYKQTDAFIFLDYCRHSKRPLPGLNHLELLFLQRFIDIYFSKPRLWSSGVMRVNEPD